MGSLGDELEINEDDIFENEHDGNQACPIHSDDSLEAPSRQHRLDLGSSGSPTSTSLRRVLEDEECIDSAGGIQIDQFDNHIRSPMRGRDSLCSSVPVGTKAVKMGTSAPINIPFMGRWKSIGEEEGEPEADNQYPATFIPPHQLSQKDDFMFSWTGQSPSVAIKKDRLKVRNQILKSTGFLESGVRDINTVGLQERTRITLNTGGLSQALHSAASLTS